MKHNRSELIQVLSNYHVVTSEIDIRDDAKLYIQFYKMFSEYDDNQLYQLLKDKLPYHPYNNKIL